MEGHPDERQIESAYNFWKKSGTDVTPGQLLLTDKRLVFAGHTPKSFGRGIVTDLLIDKVVEHTHRNKEKSFEIPLGDIQAVSRPKGLLNRNALDIETADRTYRIADAKKWEEPIRTALEGLHPRAE